MERQAQERNEHELQCQKLIGCFKTTASTLKDTVTSIERFADTYKVDCLAAINRLVISGVPATGAPYCRRRLCIYLCCYHGRVCAKLYYGDGFLET